MKNNTKWIWIIFALWFGIPLFFSIFLSMFTEEGDSANDYARIVDMDYSAKVVDEPGCEGKIVVTERMTFDVHAASRSNGFWELWRDLCEDYVDGLKVYYKVNSVKQIMPNGQEIVWEESDKLYWDDWDYVSSNTKYGPGKWYHSPGPYDEDHRRYECVFFYVDDLYREKITFEIEYEMYNAVLRYGDCSELYISMFSEDSVNYLESFKGEILIPNKDMPSKGNYKVTTYGTEKDSFSIEESASKNFGYYTFYFELDENDLKFRPYNEYIEFDLVSFGEDKHIFADYASQNDYYYDDALEEILDEQAYYENISRVYEGYKIIALFVCIFLSFLIVLCRFLKLNSYKKKLPYYSTNKFNDIYRDIPSDLDPKFAAALVSCKERKREDDEGVYSAILLSLARKNYIQLEEISTNDVRINVIEEKESKLENVYVYDEFGQLVHDDLGNPKKEVVFVEGEPLPPREPLTMSEEHYLNLIKRHAKENTITMDTLQSRISSDYSYTNSFEKKIEKVVVDTGVGLGYFQKANWLEAKYKLSSMGSFWGWVFLIFVNIFSNQTKKLIFLNFLCYTVIRGEKYAKKGILFK